MSSTNQHNTIFLIPEERLRKAFKGRLQKCEVLAGQPRDPDNPKSHLVSTAALLSDMYTAAPEIVQNVQKGRPHTVVAFAVGKP